MDKLLGGTSLAIVITVLALWYLQRSAESPADTASSTPAATTSSVVFASTRAGGLRPNVVTAATKLGQGRPAVAGLPRQNTYELPTLRTTSAGMALQIPPTGLPGTQSFRTLSPAESAAVAGAGGLDLYSWYEGTLQATSAASIGAGNQPQIPDALEAIIDDHPGQDLLVVLPPGTPGLPVALNKHDAYIAIVAVSGS